MKKIILSLFAIVLSSTIAYSQCTTKPTINSFSPNTGFIGSTVTINGANFDATNISNNKVFFGATQATIQSANFGQLVVKVPIGATTSRISVTNQCNLTAYSKAPFNGIFCPTPLDNSTYQNTAQDLPITYGAYNMIAVDLDLDGKPEVLSGGQGGGVSVAKNNSTPGNISFSALNFSQFGASSIYTADFDGDGKQDIVSRNVALLNTSSGPGNIAFSSAISTNSVSSYQVAAGDFNNDGKIDIVGEDGNVMYVAQNNSTGIGNLSFGSRQNVGNVGTRCTGIMVADVDGDGKQDILATQGNLDRAITLRNITPNGSPTFQFEVMETWATNGDYPYRCQIADFNKDGKIDLTTCNFRAPANTAVFINTSIPGDISFASTINLPAPNNNYRIQVGDVDGDGYPDIVTKSTAQNVFSIYKNTTSNIANTTFASRIDYSSSARAEVSGLVIGDLDGDFVPDIGTSGTSSRAIRIHRNTSSQADNTAPTAICQNVNVGLSPQGTVTVLPSQVDNGSSDACGIDNITLSQTVFTCADIGDNPVTLIVTDVAGNVDSCTAIVNVQPAAIIVAGQTTVCGGQTIPLTANPGDSYQWKKDGVDIVGATSQTYTASITGSYTVVVTNAGGCSGESVATSLTVNNNPTVTISPTNAAIRCGGYTTLTASNSATYQWQLNGVDIPNANIQTLNATQVGTYTVSVIDIFGCSATSDSVVVGLGLPQAFAKDTTVYLDENGNLSLSPSDVDDGTAISCAGGTLSVNPNTFDCNNLGTHTVTLTVSFGGNTSSATATVTVRDTTSPILNMTSPTIYVDNNGNATLSAQAVDNGTTDNCNVASLAISQSTFTCDDLGQGSVSQSVPVSLIGTKALSQHSHGSGFNPHTNEFWFPQWNIATTHKYDANTNGSLGTTNLPTTNNMQLWIDGESTDTYTANWGLNTVNRYDGNTLVWSYNLGTTAGAITTDDTYAYAARYYTNQIHVLDKNTGAFVRFITLPGNMYFYGGLVHANGKLYNGGNAQFGTIPNSWQALHVFDLSDDSYISSHALNPNVITYWGAAFDGENIWFGNQSNTIWGYKVSSGNSFSGSGGTPVVFTATDGSGNTSSDTTYITVLDTLAPSIQTNNITVNLDDSGNASISLSDVNNGASDNCGVDSVYLSGNSSFTCANLGANTVYVVATDSSGNIDSAAAVITVSGVDTDGDGVPNACDLDDDNDGITDINECPTDNFYWSNPPVISANPKVATGTINGIAYTYTSSVNIGTTSYMFNHGQFPSQYNVPNGTTIRNDFISSNTLVFSQPVTDPLLVFASIGQPGVFVPIQFSDSINVVWSTAVTQNSATRITGNEGFAIVRIFGVYDSISFDYLQNESWVNFTFGADFTNVCDDDLDGIINPLDLDSDGDGCADALEAGHLDGDEDGILGSSPISVDSDGLVINQGGYSGSTSIVLDATQNVCNQPPVAACQNITIYTGSNCDASISAADVDGGSTDPDGDVITFAVNNSGPFGVGTYAVTLTVSDPDGELDTCSAIVTVVDSTAPIAIAQDIDVYLDASGNGTIVATDVDNGSTDECGVASLSIDKSTFDCSDIGGGVSAPAPYGWWNAENNFNDISGNSNNGSGVNSPTFGAGSCSQAFVFNGVGSHVDAGNDANFSGNTAMTIAAWIKPSSNTDEDQIVSKSTHGVPSGWEFRRYGTTLQFTFRAVNGGQYSTSASVLSYNVWQHVSASWDGTTMSLYKNGSLVHSYIPPSSMNTNNFSMKIGENQGFGNTHGAFNGSIDEVMFFTSALNATEMNQIATCNPSFGSSGVQLTVTDVNGNFSAASANVTVIDTVSPVAQCANITVQLDASGNANILSPSSTSNIFLEDFSSDANAGNSSSLTNWNVLSGNIDVNDFTTGNGREIDMGGNVNATIETKNSINLSPGTYEFSFHHLTNSNPNPNNSLNIQIGSLLNETFPAPSSVQQVTRTITVTSATSVTVRMQEVGTNDNSGTFIGNIQINRINPAGLLINNNSSDNCGIASISASKTSFSCADVGSNSVILTVIDNSGNTSTCTSTVTVVDTTLPTVVTQDLTIYLDAQGSASITAQDVDNGSSDVCGVASVAVTPNTFGCSELGENIVTLSATDVNGNVNTNTAVITVVDTLIPIIATTNVTISLDSLGNASIVEADVAAATDNCGISSLSLDNYDFDCSSVGQVNTVTITAEDNSGAGPQGTFTDYSNLPSFAQSPRTVLIAGDVNNDGKADVQVTQTFYTNLGNGTSFNGRGLTQTSPGAAMGDLNGDGNLDVINGNTVFLWNGSYMGFKETLPLSGVVFQHAALVDLDGDGDLDYYSPTYYQSTEQVYLNDGTASFTLDSSYAVGSFQMCATSGDMDNDGDEDIITAGYYDVYLASNDGNANLTYTSIFSNGTNYISAIRTADLNGDGNLDIVIGQVSSSTTILFGNGNGTFQSPVVLNGSVNGHRGLQVGDWEGDGDIDILQTDPTGIVLWKNNGSGTFQEEITGYTGYFDAVMADFNGDGVNDLGMSRSGIGNIALSDVGTPNSNTATAAVTVEDNFPPTVLTQDITIALDSSGNASIVAADIDNGSNDACGISSLSVSPNTFNCSNVGANTVILTVTDVNNNVSTQTAVVTVNDTAVVPSALTQDVTVYLDATGSASITPSMIDNGSTDACGIDSLALDNSNFDCSDVGLNTVNLTVWDVNNNSSTNSSTVTVLDTIKPTITGCPGDITVNNLTGNCFQNVMWIMPSATDNCGVTSIVESNDGSILILPLGNGIKFGAFPVGSTEMKYTVTDDNGNVSICTFNVVVEDNENPYLYGVSPDITVNNDPGTCGAYVTWTPPTVSDNCPNVMLYANHNPGETFPVGVTTVVYDLMDPAGNSVSDSFNITVIDNELPNAMSQSLSVYLDAQGSGSITTAMINNGSTDNCGIDTMFLSSYHFNCSNVGPNNITLTVNDIHGNSNTSVAAVTVIDTVAPIALSQDITVQLDASGNASIVAADVNNGSNDACGVTLAVSPSAFTCNEVGANTVTLTVTDNNGNVSTATAVVTVEDNVAPIALTQDITVQLDASGNASIVAADVDNSSNDACGVASLVIDNASFTCANVGANTVTLTVTDVNNNVSTATAVVTVEDNVAPMAIAQDITVQLDASGNASIVAADVDNGSNDACGVTLSIDNASFTCANVGANTVTLTVTDANNNVSTTTAVVTVEDNVAPTAIAQDITVQLDASGNVSIVAADVDNGSNDACGVTLAIDNASFTCANVGANTVTLTVTDANNNVSTATAVVTVEDNVAPIAIAQDITVQLDASGNASIVAADVDNGSNDACGVTLAIDNASFTCANVGANTVTLTVTDANNNVSTATAVVTVEDNVAPMAIAQDITVQLDASGNVSIVAADVDNGSNDACGVTLAIDNASFTCANVGANTVTLTVTDANNNVSTATAVVTVEDNVAPIAITQDITVQLDASGNVSIVAADVDNGSNDACGVTLSIDNASFTCANVGANTVTLTVTDANNNVSTATAVVTVEDNVAPIAIAQDITVQLDASGNVSIVAADVDNGSNDACGVTLAIDNASFTCANVGANTVTLTVTDANNNVSTATAVVTVEDNVAPIALTQDITVQLDASGNASIVAADVDNGSNDACGVTLAIDNASFTCANVGANTVTLTVTDANNNVSTATAVVTVEDNVAPIAIAQDITVQLDASGNASIVAADVDNGSNDACGVTLSIDNASFTCANVGANTVTLTVTDANNNVSTATAVVTVEDNVAPIAIAQDITVQLDASGNASIVAADVDNGSNDACGVTLAIDNTSFTCANVGANTVTLTVTDANNNVSTATAVVTIEDNVAPIAIAQDITVQLDASGNASIVAADVDNGSNDACGVTMSVSPSAFTCNEVGANTVTLTVTDANSNVSTATAVVTVEDNVAPIAIAQDITVQLDASGNASIVAEDVDNGSNDACGADLRLSTNNFDCSDVGANTITLTVTDANSNVSTATAVVTVEDNVAPTALTQDITVQLDASGNASIVAADVDNGSNDACGVTLAVSPSTFRCNEVGANTVTLTVTDDNGNVSTANALVTVEDNVAPIAIAQDITVQLDASGNASIVAADVDNGSNDACGVANLAIDMVDFTCADVGQNTVTLTVTDNNGNIDTENAVVTVEDNVAPLAICNSFTATLDNTGMAIITASQVDGGSSDACGVANVSIDISSFNCADVGNNSVVLTVTDVNGNSSSCTAVVYVEDPTLKLEMANCQENITLECENATDTVWFDTPTVRSISAYCGISCNVGDTLVCLGGSAHHDDDDDDDDDDYSNNGHNTSGNSCHGNNHGHGHSSHGNGNGYGHHNGCNLGYANNNLEIPGYTFLGKHNGMNYYMSHSRYQKWTQAEALATNYGGHLAVISNMLENDFIEEAVGNNKVWIGLSDHNSEGNYEWTNGDALNYTNWDKNEPRTYNSSGKRDYAVMYKKGKWRMKNHYDRYKYVMEVPCNNSNLSVTQIAGLPSGSVFPQGTTTVTFVALDHTSGLSDTCSFNVTVNGDNDAPTVRCKSNQSFTLVDGMLTILPSDIDNGSYDNCSGIATSQVVPNTFNLGNTGDNQVTLIVTDSAGNVDSCHSVIDIIDPNAITYCSVSGNTRYEWIQEVTIGNFNNNSGNNSGYGDFTGTPINLNRGSVSLELTPGYAGKCYSEYWRVWIDYNHDGDFNDWGECVYQKKRKNTVTGSFSITNSRADGTYSMRIGMKYGSYPDPCGYCGYGEFEDYKITIGSAPSARKKETTIADVANFEQNDELNVVLYPNPTKDIFNIEFDNDFDSNVDIEIRSINGKLIRKEQVNGLSIQGKLSFDMSNQANGIYFISIRRDDIVKVIKFSKM